MDGAGQAAAESALRTGWRVVDIDEEQVASAMTRRTCSHSHAARDRRQAEARMYGRLLTSPLMVRSDLPSAAWLSEANMHAQ